MAKQAKSPLAPSIEIELAGKTRHLQFTALNMIAYKRKTGENLLGVTMRFGVMAGALENVDAENPDSVVSVMDALDMEIIAKVVWGCLLHEDDSLTLEEVAMSIDLTNFNDVVLKIGEVLSQSMPKADGKKARPTTGRNSLT